MGTKQFNVKRNEPERTSNATLLNFQNYIFYGNDSWNGGVLCYQKNGSNNDASSCEVIRGQNEVEEYGVTFWLLVALVLVSSFAGVGIYPVLEATTFQVLGKKNRHKYGRQRLWASIGFGLAALSIGFLKGEK